MKVRVLSFNLRLAVLTDGKNRWSKRSAAVMQEVRLIQPDVMGLQEATHEMYQELKGELSEYRFLGTARENGVDKGEYSAIGYRPDRLKLIKEGRFWLSETPEEVGSFGWDADCVRIANWAVFEAVSGGDRFFFLNTHTDHRGERARLESSKLIRKRATLYADGIPIVVTGDFNASPDAESIRALTRDFSESRGADPTDWGEDVRARALKDTRSICETEHLGPDFTYHGFKLAQMLQDPGKLRFKGIIDYIFVSPEVSCVLHAASCDMFGDICISDHLPLIADLLL